MLRSTFAFCLVVVLVQAANFKWGSPHPSEKRLISTYISIESKDGSSKSQEITTKNPTGIISRIAVTDKSKEGNINGEATIDHGGIGQTSVIIKLTTRGKAKFLVEVFGHNGTSSSAQGEKELLKKNMILMGIFLILISTKLGLF